VQRKSIKKVEQESRMMRLSPGLSVAGFQNCNIVIEAVFEDIRLKQKILSDVGGKVSTPHDEEQCRVFSLTCSGCLDDESRKKVLQPRLLFFPPARLRRLA